MQAAIGIEGAQSGLSMEWDPRGDPAALWSALQGLNAADIVVGVGEPLMTLAGARIEGVQPVSKTV
jgi:hypothetical protein